MEYQENKEKERDRKPPKKIRIGITMGDVGGIGPELIIRSFQEPGLRDMFSPVVYGSGKALNFYRKNLGIEKFSYNLIQKASQAQPRKINLVDSLVKTERIDSGMATELGGELSLDALNVAIQDIKAGELDALVTLPLDKKTVSHYAPNFLGHTEYLAEHLGAKDFMMIMTSETLKVGLVTGHLPLKDVSGRLSSEIILGKIRLMNHSLKMDFNLQRPRIAVLGLNPHAGDTGLLGSEEQKIINVALKQAEQEGIFALGPHSPDGFFASGAFSKFDGILAMYHDQGLIPFKLISGWAGVNFTAGLPIVRTSPDHGVAYDLAGQGIASLDSFMNALYAAEDIFNHRTENEALIKGSIRNRHIKVDLGEEEGEVAIEE